MSRAKYFGTDVMKCALSFCRESLAQESTTCPSAKRVALPRVICRDETRRDETRRDEARRDETRQDGPGRAGTERDGRDETRWVGTERDEARRETKRKRRDTVAENGWRREAEATEKPKVKPAGRAASINKQKLNCYRCEGERVKWTGYTMYVKRKSVLDVFYALTLHLRATFIDISRTSAFSYRYIIIVFVHANRIERFNAKIFPLLNYKKSSIKIAVLTSWKSNYVRYKNTFHFNNSISAGYRCFLSYILETFHY